MEESTILTVSVLLLVLRITATGLLVRVMKTQLSLMKRPIDTEIAGFRKSLFFLTLALALSNILPIVFDTAIIVDTLGVFGYSIDLDYYLLIYTLSNALGAVLASFLVYRIYKDALTVDESHSDSDHTLIND